MRKVLLVGVPIGAREQVERVRPSDCEIAVSETCKAGLNQFQQERSDIVLVNARMSDGLYGWNARSLAEEIRKTGKAVIAISPFMYDRVPFEAAGCLFCRPEESGEALKKALSR